MSREIKFRAWDKNRKGYINGFNMFGFSRGQGCLYKKLQRFSDEWKDGDFELQQFTGLKDKNGKEIYEGDIMRNVKNGCIATVQWHGTMAGFVLSNLKEKSQTTREWGELFRAYDKYEVIGNIYDNPELLVQE